MQTISFVLCSDMLASSATLPMEMLKAGESFARAKNRRALELNIQSVADTKEPIKTRSGFSLVADQQFKDSPESDIIFLPALWRNPRPIIQSNESIFPWLIERVQNGATVSAVGTGVCFLAEAKLLDGKAATTHWHYFDQFQKYYPSVDLKRQYFITQSGNIFCAASVNALADLTVHFIQRLYNQEVANHVERHFSHEIRRSYQERGYFDGEINQHPDEDIVQAQMWLQDNYGKDIQISDVAERFEMSVRSFNRRFKNATNKSPLQYLQEIRIQVAKDLLQTSNLTISEIAFKVGYSDMGHFTGLFKKLLATTPSEYRTTVRAKLFRAKI
ncbi:GlxA family transcriptional regulator [Sessilibacter corallicola]|uniref:GlxA family transcriptional regulator n=1 Tax=Sessilibacter corallicola TaxID=2904075 RepID=UPI001E34F1A4|nr:helix-turn-helix domain-containing protein [Sessilibacter corallicola]MCE2029199.1 helix-turn-helix domain-containing protein [Sessilibacter corallicola]